MQILHIYWALNKLKTYILNEYILLTSNVAMKATILYYKIQSVCVIVCLYVHVE